jgi:hypothetical protein
MIDRIRPAVAPIYLFLCLLLGGSPQGYWAMPYSSCWRSS